MLTSSVANKGRSAGVLSMCAQSRSLKSSCLGNMEILRVLSLSCTTRVTRAPIGSQQSTVVKEWVAVRWVI